MTMPSQPAQNATEKKDVVIVGAGIAGLACARRLAASGLQVLLVEAESSVGGRVRTDELNGFRLDRGFQVLLTGYPEAQAVLDYQALDLCAFRPGAMVYHGGRFHRFADPFREPARALRFAIDPILPLQDKLQVARLRRDVLRFDPFTDNAELDESARDFLRNRGFSSAILDRFFSPFFGGVFLERNLSTSSRWFRWLFRLFATGNAVVPRLGMQAIPQQMADALPAGMLQYGQRVERLEHKPASGKEPGVWTVHLDSGQAIAAHRVVLATPEPVSRKLLATVRPPGVAPVRTWNRTTTFYYAASHSPLEEPVLALNGEGQTAGPVNHLAVMSQVSAAYAPAGAHLICANIVGSAPETDESMHTLEQETRNHLRRWFGSAVHQWQVLAGYPIQYALPMTAMLPVIASAPIDSGIVLCGDHLTSPSIQGALVSGRLAAERILNIAGN